MTKTGTCGGASGAFVAVAFRSLFVTPLYEADITDERGFGPADFVEFNAELEAACLSLAQEDRAGRAWAKAHGYPGYTSYASLDDLPTRASVFGDLKRRLDRHAASFADDLALDLGRRRLRLDSLWVNVLRPARSGGASHSGHVHPLSVISGTLYVTTPPGSGAIRFEDPRLPMMMAAPPRLQDAPETRRLFVSIDPRPGLLLLWESWLRHEVTSGSAKAARISISFNYAWSPG